MPARHRSGVVLLAALLALSAGWSVLGASPVRADESPSGELRLMGKSLREALQILRARGLNIVFTTNVVRSDMLVRTDPGDRSNLRAVLAEILEPHDLETRPAPRDTLVVVPRDAPVVPVADDAPGSVVGFVRSINDPTPIEGVAIRVVDDGPETRSGPDGTFALSGLDEGSVTLELRRRGFVVELIEDVPVSSGEVTRLPIFLNPAPVTAEELVVTPSQISLLRREPAAAVSLSQDEILSLPHLGDDFFRALSLLPGISASDASAEFHVRGGRRDETRIVLDGQELYDTFHLKEFDSALSIIAPTTLASVDLSTGSFTAEHGDRMSGVLDMTSLTPSGPARGRAGIGLLGAELGGAGTFADERGSWIAQLRRGANDFAGKLLGPERPIYWDGFGKIDYQLRPGNSLRANALVSDDTFQFDEVTVDGTKNIDTDYQSSYFWITDQAILGNSFYLETAISRSNVERDRNGVEVDEDVEWILADRRDLDVSSVRQNWNYSGRGHQLKWGFELRRFDSRFDYSSDFSFESPIGLLRTNGPEGAIGFVGRFEESHESLFASNRFELGDSATLEIGGRYDRHSQTDESHLTPRLNLAISLGQGSLVRAAWGRFNQSQRPYELQVEDGDTLFRRVERSEHRLLGFEHLFRSAPGAGITLRIELYDREIKNPQPRWENFYEPLNEFQEVEPDRIRVAPERSFARGIELFLRGRAGSRTGWFVNYTLSEAEDQIGGKRQLRRFDQTHSLNLDFDFQVSEKWTLNLAWRYHTGWPTTPLTLFAATPLDPEPGIDPDDDSDGEPGEPETVFIPVLGEPFSDRLADYHRLDLRASRRWSFRSGQLTLFADIQNVYDRKNASGFDYEVEEDEGILIPNPEQWTGFFPSLGLRWEF